MQRYLLLKNSGFFNIANIKYLNQGMLHQVYQKIFCKLKSLQQVFKTLSSLSISKAIHEQSLEVIVTPHAWNTPARFLFNLPV